jgi:hypothetical protein
VAELVAEEVLVDRGLPEEDRLPGRVPVEAPEPRQPEENGHEEDSHPVDADRLRVEAKPVESGLGALEELATL